MFSNFQLHPIDHLPLPKFGATRQSPTGKLHLQICWKVDFQMPQINASFILFFEVGYTIYTSLLWENAWENAWEK